MTTRWEDTEVIKDNLNTQNRVMIEFYCQECDHYTYIRMNLSLSGNHIMNCPNCNHKHYRAVKKGIITSDRFDKNIPNSHTLIAMKSACVSSDQRRVRGKIAHLREMEAVGAIQ